VGQFEKFDRHPGNRKRSVGYPGSSKNVLQAQRIEPSAHFRWIPDLPRRESASLSGMTTRLFLTDFKLTYCAQVSRDTVWIQSRRALR
jgi:hypothetical protein